MCNEPGNALNKGSAMSYKHTYTESQYQYYLYEHKNLVAFI